MPEYSSSNPRLVIFRSRLLNTIRKSEGQNFWRYTRDYENRMVEASTRKQKVRYKYDALGRRVQRFRPGWEENTKFTHDGLDVLVDNDNGTLTKYLNGPGIDNKLRVQTGSSVNYFLSDQLRSTNGLTDGTGNLTSSASYDSFGNKTGNLATRYQFTGREYDSFSGFYYYRARFYDSSLGRFTSEDPIGLAGGENLYYYVGNNPTQFVDPLGLFPIFWPWDRHQDITRRALDGLATPRQIQSLTWANENFDKTTQDLEFSPQHAMRIPGQSPEDAQAEANKFVRNKICTARVYASRGWNTDALHQLGQAMHTLQDNQSPTHSGFQESWPFGVVPVIKNLKHYVHEALFPGQRNLKAAEDATRKAWESFNGAPMPRDFFSNSADDNGTCSCSEF